MWRLVVVAFAFLLAGCGPYDPTSAPDLAMCYKAEFQTDPPAGITVLNARQMVIRDWGAQWLKMKAQSNLIDDIILEKFGRVRHPPQAFSGPKDRYTPDWWILPPANQLEFYECNEWTRGSFHSSRAVVAVDRTNGIVCFRCDRVD